MNTTGFLKALSDDTRLRTFRILTEAQQGLCVAEMADVLRKPQYAVSRSFIELKKAGLVDEDRRGKFVYYSLVDTPSARELGAWVLGHCFCEDERPHNSDGSSLPGGEACHYDSERLKWRLSLRDPSQPPVTRTQEKATLDPRPRVLFVCVHNSARSQLAEEFLLQLAGDRYAVESAGLTPGSLNPHVVAVLAERGIDIRHKRTQAVSDLYRRGETFQWVITVCSREAEEGCPVFPGPVRRLSWPFPDPSTFEGSEAEIRDQVRQVADAIRDQIQAFVDENNKESL